MDKHELTFDNDESNNYIINYVAPKCGVSLSGTLALSQCAKWDPHLAQDLKRDKSNYEAYTEFIEEFKDEFKFDEHPDDIKFYNHYHYPPKSKYFKHHYEDGNQEWIKKVCNIYIFLFHRNFFLSWHFDN